MSRAPSSWYLPLMAAVVCACNGTPRGGEESRVPDDRVSREQPSVAAPAASPSTEPRAVEASSSPVTIPEKNAAVAEALRYDPADPLGDLEKADSLDRGAGRMPEADVKVPARGCALLAAPRRIWTEPGIASVAALGNDFVVAGYVRSDQGERMFVVRVSDSGALEPVATFDIAPAHPSERAAGPGLAARLDQGVTLAFTDGSGALFMQQLQVGGHRGAAVSVKLATGVDTRFAPAVSYGKNGALLAYTLGQTPMRSMLVRIGARSEVLSTHDVTPAGSAAAAPAFVSGAVPNVLVTADPRDGMSPIGRTLLDAEGKPTSTEIAAPVGMMSRPAQLTAAGAGFGTFVGYTGLGAASTSAVGLVQILPKAGSPEALIKGTAYGALHVAAVRSGGALVFAADSPLTAGKDPKHDLTLTRIDAQGKGTALHVVSPTGDATHVALASNDDGVLGVVFRASDGVYWAKARCGE